MRSVRFSKQKSFHSFKTKGVSNFKTAFDLALYIVYRMSGQDNATFVEQSLSTEVVRLDFRRSLVFGLPSPRRDGWTREWPIVSVT